LKKNKRISGTGAGIVLGLGLILSAASVSSAQVNFGISPIRAEHAIKPGESRTDVFLLRNNSPGPIRIKVYTENWILSAEGTPSFIGSRPTTYSGKDWIIVNPTDFRLMPDEIKSVRYTVTVPPDTPPGGYHAAISFETVPDTAGLKAGAKMLFSGKIAAAVYILAGDPAIEGDLFDLKLGVKDNAPAVELGLSNTGKRHFRVKGTVRLYDASGEKTFDLTVPDEVVLPESRRSVFCAFPRPPEPGTYRAVAEIDIGRPEILEMERSLEVVK